MNWNEYKINTNWSKKCFSFFENQGRQIDVLTKQHQNTLLNAVKNELFAYKQIYLRMHVIMS